MLTISSTNCTCLASISRGIDSGDALAKLSKAEITNSGTEQNTKIGNTLIRRLLPNNLAEYFSRIL